LRPMAQMVLRRGHVLPSFTPPLCYRPAVSGGSTSPCAEDCRGPATGLLMVPDRPSRGGEYRILFN